MMPLPSSRVNHARTCDDWKAVATAATVEPASLDDRDADPSDDRSTTPPALPAALTSCVQAQAPTPVVRTPLAVALRPTSIPDRIIRTFAADPARSIAVTWRTDPTIAGAIAQVALAEHGPRFAKNARTVPAASQDLTTNLGVVRCHSAVIAGLLLQWRFILMEPGATTKETPDADRRPDRMAGTI